MASHRDHRRRMLPRVEHLERLQLLSSTFVDGTWTIKGTAGPDTIAVDRSPTAPGLLRAFVDGRLIDTRAASSVRRIHLEGLGGDDTLEIDEGHGPIAIASVLSGGAGRNILIGGSGPTTLDGGPGKDSILQPGTGPTALRRGAAADSVRPFGSLRAFRRFLARAAANPAGTGPVLNGAAGGSVTAPSAPNAPTPTGAAAGSYSTTNVQVPGVGEGDTVETDGSFLYLLSRGELVIVDARQPGAPAVASRTTIQGSPLAEYLDGSRLTVLSSLWRAPLTPLAGGAGAPVATPVIWYPGSAKVEVTTYDVSDPTSPKVVKTTELDGSYAGSRMVDGRLYLVVQSDLFGAIGGGPIPAAGAGAAAGKGHRTVPAARARGRGRASIDRILPGYTATARAPDGTTTTRSGPISQARDILEPASGNATNLISVVALDTRSPDPAPIGSASLFGSYTSTMYVTPENLYIFSPHWDDRGGPTTSIAQFALAKTSPSLVATGSVPGTLLDQYSADANAGYLRVATTAWSSETPDNGLYVLQQKGDRLNVVGMVDQLAPGERLDAARFEGNRAFLVTFHQVDPLWGVDLTNPTAPVVAGQLTLPGYSEYLQPIDTDYLLGLGREVDPATNETTGLKLSLFDVHDLSHPALVASQAIAPNGSRWSWSAAEWDPHAFGWFPELNVVAIPVQGSVPIPVDPPVPIPAGAPGTNPTFVPWMPQSDLYVFRVDTAAGAQALQPLGTVAHTSSTTRTVRIVDVLYSIADEDVQSVRVLDNGLSPLGQVTIQTGTSGWPGGPLPVVPLA